MNIVIDTNILISILIKPNGKIAELFYPLKEKHSLYISDYTFSEVAKHNSKLKRLTRLNSEEFERLKLNLFSYVKIISTELIPEKFLIQEYYLIKNIDVNDLPFISVALMVFYGQVIKNCIMV